MRHTCDNIRHAHIYAAAANIVRNDLARVRFQARCNDAMNTGSMKSAFIKRKRTWRGGLKNSAGEMLVKEAAVEHAADFYAELYRSRFPQSGPRWIWRRWSESGVATLPPLSGYLVRTCLHKMRTDKTCWRDDMVVAEMLQTVPEHELLSLSDRHMLEEHSDDTSTPHFTMRVISTHKTALA